MYDLVLVFVFVNLFVCILFYSYRFFFNFLDTIFIELRLRRYSDFREFFFEGRGIR